MGVAHQISRITEVFGREPALLQWVLRDPVARTSGLLANLSEMQRGLLYRYCVLGPHEGEISDCLAEAYLDGSKREFCNGAVGAVKRDLNKQGCEVGIGGQREVPQPRVACWRDLASCALVA